MNQANPINRMIVVDGVDGSGKGVQTRRLYQSLLEAGHAAILTREPGGSPAAEDIRQLLVAGDPKKWDSMTELLLMYAARRSHLRDTIWPALAADHWVVSDRFADSSRAFQGIAGGVGLEAVEGVHEIALGDFSPELVLVLDIPVETALQRARERGDGEDRFEKKGSDYQKRVRDAFLQIAAANPVHYRVINADRSRDEVSDSIVAAVNQHFGLDLEASHGID